MKKALLFILFIITIALPLNAANERENLSKTLQDLRRNMKRDYLQMAKTQDRLAENYESQHMKMVDLMKQCNELSLILYSQKQEFTFDLCYALEKVTEEFNDFEKDRMPYDRIVGNLDIEIDRYARLLETLRRLPPELENIDGVAYGTDVQQVREVIENAMQVMCTKDQFGRDIVDPRHGIYVRLGDFGDSAVNIAVKQYVLAAERIPYIDKAKEVIYNALNESGISIPFPQCDIHVVSEEMK